MKALVIPSVGTSVLQDMPEPKPGPGEVLLDVRHVGLCGSDLATFTGLNPLVSLPRIPGHELGVEILEAGADVPADLRPGQRGTVLPYTSCGQCASCRKGRVNACRYNRTLGVQQDGGLAERLVVPWQKFIPVPDMAPGLLPLIEPLSVGFHAVSRGRVAAGDRVVVLGCGMIGMGVVSAAAARGAEVIAVDHGDRAARALVQGAAHAVSVDDAPARIAELTGGDGADVVIEAVGLPETFVRAIDLAAFGGRVVYIGYAKAAVSYDTTKFNLKELDIMGSRNALADDFDAVISYLRSGKGDPAGLITGRYPFLSADAALPFWAANRASTLKIVVER